MCVKVVMLFVFKEKLSFLNISHLNIKRVKAQVLSVLFKSALLILLETLCYLLHAVFPGEVHNNIDINIIQWIPIRHFSSFAKLQENGRRNIFRYFLGTLRLDFGKCANWKFLKNLQNKAERRAFWWPPQAWKSCSGRKRKEKEGKGECGVLNGVGERRGEAFAQRKKMDELQLQRYARSYLLKNSLRFKL